MLCCWVEDPNSEAFKLHLPRIHDYLWVAEDGMKMQVPNIFYTWLWYVCHMEEGDWLPNQYIITPLESLTQQYTNIIFFCSQI